MAQPPGYPVPPLDMPNEREHRGLIAASTQLAMAGKTNNVDSITLAAGAASTTFSNSRIGYNSAVLLMPTTANAAGALAALYIDTFLNGSCVIHHANTATTDRTFKVVIVG